MVSIPHLPNLCNCLLLKSPFLFYRLLQRLIPCSPLLLRKILNLLPYYLTFPHPRFRIPYHLLFPPFLTGTLSLLGFKKMNVFHFLQSLFTGSCRLSTAQGVHRNSTTSAT